jgi:hypothetical protein
MGNLRACENGSGGPETVAAKIAVWMFLPDNCCTFLLGCSKYVGCRWWRIEQSN